MIEPCNETHEHNRKASSFFKQSPNIWAGLVMILAKGINARHGIRYGKAFIGHFKLSCDHHEITQGSSKHQSYSLNIRIRDRNIYDWIRHHEEMLDMYGDDLDTLSTFQFMIIFQVMLRIVHSVLPVLIMRPVIVYPTCGAD